MIKRISCPAIFALVLSVTPLAFSEQKSPLNAGIIASELCASNASPFAKAVNNENRAECINLFKEELFNCQALAEERANQGAQAIQKCAEINVRKSRWYKDLVANAG